MEYIKAKTIITKNKSTAWFGSDYNMNIYRGCSHGCIYCDSRSECYNNPDFDTVKAKEDALKIIRDELRRKVRKGVVATGSMSDPYNPFEKEEKLTRNALELINAYYFGVAIATKSTLITRDIDILKDIKEHSPVIAKITITTAEDELAKKIEPSVFSSSERFEAVEQLAKEGICTGILLMPLLPFINDTPENVGEIIKKAKNAGAGFIYPSFGVTLRTNQRDYYFSCLDKDFKGLKEKYEKVYGYKYSCQSKNAKALYELFSETCYKEGILCKMEDIIRKYKAGYEASQLSFFD